MAKKPAQKTETKTPEGRKVPKEVQIKLTPKQCAERADQAAAISKEKVDLQAEFEAEEKAWKQRRAEFKNALKNKSEQIDKLLAEVKAKRATSTEQVTLVLNHDANAAEYWYQPEGGEWEIVDTRPLEENERQTSFIKEQAEAMPETGQSVQA